MNIKLNILSAAVLAVVSTAGFAGVGTPVTPNEPPAVDGIYNAGPQSPDVAKTDISLAERTAYANYEAILQIAEARIHATSCSNSAGTFDVHAFSDGLTASPTSNYATVVSPGGSFTVQANSNASDPKPPLGNDRGQIMFVSMGSGILKQRSVQNYSAQLAYNSANNMMDSTSRVQVFGINNRYDTYTGKVIKDFYNGTIDPNSTDRVNIYDWGLQSLDKENYPVNKYWQRSKSHRSDGTIGRTVFVKDRLVGATSCRIIIDTLGDNNQDFFNQTGSLIIQTGVAPNAPVPAFTELPFFPF